MASRGGERCSESRNNSFVARRTGIPAGGKLAAAFTKTEFLSRLPELCGVSGVDIFRESRSWNRRAVQFWNLRASRGFLDVGPDNSDSQTKINIGRPDRKEGVNCPKCRSGAGQANSVALRFMDGTSASAFL